MVGSFLNPWRAFVQKLLVLSYDDAQEIRENILLKEQLSSHTKDKTEPSMDQAEGEQLLHSRVDYMCT
jgi:hypothetical protein